MDDIFQHRDIIIKLDGKHAFITVSKTPEDFGNVVPDNIDPTMFDRPVSQYAIKFQKQREAWKFKELMNKYDSIRKVLNNYFIKVQYAHNDHYYRLKTYKDNSWCSKIKKMLGEATEKKEVLGRYVVDREFKSKRKSFIIFIRHNPNTDDFGSTMDHPSIVRAAEFKTNGDRNYFKELLKSGGDFDSILKKYFTSVEYYDHVYEDAFDIYSRKK